MNDHELRNEAIDKLKEMSKQVRSDTVDSWYVGGYHCGLSNNGHLPNFQNVESAKQDAWRAGRADGEGDRLAWKTEGE